MIFGYIFPPFSIWSIVWTTNFHRFFNRYQTNFSQISSFSDAISSNLGHFSANSTKFDHFQSFLTNFSQISAVSKPFFSKFDQIWPFFNDFWPILAKSHHLNIIYQQIRPNLTIFQPFLTNFNQISSGFYHFLSPFHQISTINSTNSIRFQPNFSIPHQIFGHYHQFPTQFNQFFNRFHWICIASIRNWLNSTILNRHTTTSTNSKPNPIQLFHFNSVLNCIRQLKRPISPIQSRKSQLKLTGSVFYAFKIRFLQ